MSGAQPPISPEVVAAIMAALATVLDQPLDQFVVTKIQAERPAAVPAPSIWSKAGLLESQLARRQFGIRSR